MPSSSDQAIRAISVVVTSTTPSPLIASSADLPWAATPQAPARGSVISSHARLATRLFNFSTLGENVPCGSRCNRASRRVESSRHPACLSGQEVPEDIRLEGPAADICSRRRVTCPPRSRKAKTRFWKSNTAIALATRSVVPGVSPEPPLTGATIKAATTSASVNHQLTRYSRFQMREGRGSSKAVSGGSTCLPTDGCRSPILIPAAPACHGFTTGSDIRLVHKCSSALAGACERELTPWQQSKEVVTIQRGDAATAAGASLGLLGRY